MACGGTNRRPLNLVAVFIVETQKADFSDKSAGYVGYCFVQSLQLANCKPQACGFIESISLIFLWIKLQSHKIGSEGEIPSRSVIHTSDYSLPRNILHFTNYS